MCSIYTQEITVYEHLTILPNILGESRVINKRRALRATIILLRSQQTTATPPTLFLPTIYALLAGPPATPSRQSTPPQPLVPAFPPLNIPTTIVSTAYSESVWSHRLHKILQLLHVTAEDSLPEIW